ncbi:MAG: hypothetical protein GQ527_10010 [Bacteroidales bacterium]|nr:hypothetical protein [Bacteroidales bacterium]
MKTSIEISYYPMKDEFIPSILDFVHRLKSYQTISVESNSMSTQVFGDYEELMAILTKEIKKSMEIPYSVFILKVINSDLQVHSNTPIDE